MTPQSCFVALANSASAQKTNLEGIEKCTMYMEQSITNTNAFIEQMEYGSLGFNKLTLFLAAFLLILGTFLGVLGPVLGPVLGTALERTLRF